MYSKIEKKYNVIYPESDSATYITLMNYSDDLNKPFQRWYRYKEGFSIDLVKQLINEYCNNDQGIILDPFAGSGSTLLAASELGFQSIGFEVNPFSFFLAKLKLTNYTKEMVDEFKYSYKKILEDSLSSVEEYPLPILSISEKVFNDDIRHYYMVVKKLIMEYPFKNYEIKELLLLGWLACLESISNYRKAGNGLKKRKYVRPRIITKNDVYKMLEKQYSDMVTDIDNNKIEFRSTLFNYSSLNMDDFIKKNSISGIIFSPPYANCFDYTEIYKLELWFGDFVKKYSDLKLLRRQSLHSHLNSDLSIDGIDLNEIDVLSKIIAEIEGKELWDKKIPNMLRLYFNDMFNIIKKSYEALEQNGFCVIVVGNSAYGGIIVPTDLLLAEYASTVGFKVDKIEVDRYIITSSQQYKITKENKKFLRESLVCLRK